jgi:beta-phosphoglucomutase
MSEFKAALFDLDGTLIDSETQYTKFWGRVGREYHPEIPDFAHIIKGTTLPHILETYFADAALQQKIVGMIDEYELQMNYDPIAGAENFVRNLKEHGVKCAVVTSSNQSKMSNVWRHQKTFMSLFDVVLTAEDFSASKPNPDCYLKAAASLHTDINDCVIFEDAFTGLEAGRRAGIFTVGLATVNSREQIIDKCNHVIDNFLNIDYDTVCSWLP